MKESYAVKERRELQTNMYDSLEGTHRRGFLVSESLVIRRESFEGKGGGAEKKKNSGGGGLKARRCGSLGFK